MSGWFVFAIIACITLCTGCILAVAVMKAAWSQKEREALTSADLRALEESAVYLIEQLKMEADQATTDLESRYARLLELIETADKKIAVLHDLQSAYQNVAEPAMLQDALHEAANPNSDPRKRQVLELASKGVECAEIARQAGMACAEVKLMLRLSGMRMN